MALSGGHVAGAGDHVGDHNLLDAQLTSLASGLSATVKTVNGTAPNAAGNVNVAGASGTVSTVNSVAPDAGGNVIVTKAMVSLGSADNTSDAAKPVSTATATALTGKEPAIARYATLAAAQTAVTNGTILDGALILVG